jgi:hypothetical protein
MLNSTRRAAVATAASILLGSTALAACSSSSNETITHNPPLSTFGGRSTARSAVQTAILVTGTSNGIAFPGGPTPAAIARRVLDVMQHGRRVSAVLSACSNGTRTSQAGNSDGSTTTITDIYYDALCTTLEEEQVLNVATPGSPTTSATGKVTTYDHSTNVTSYHSLTISATNADGTQTVTYNDAAAATTGGPVIAAVGATCAGAPSSPTMSCTAAMYGTVSSSTFGQAVADAGTAGTGGAKNGVTVNVTYYGAGITGIAQTAGTWGVSGGAGFNSATGAYTYSSTGSTGNGSFSLTDSLYTYTVTGSLTATGLAVTIVRNTDPIATATVDGAGNGLISYADGTTDVIWGGIVGV